MARPIDMQIMPIVAAVPKAVPMSMDIMEHKRNVASTKTEGESRLDEMLTISGMVPEARHAALMAPTMAKRAITERTSQIDFAAERKRALAEILREIP